MNTVVDRFIPTGTVMLAPRASQMIYTPTGTVRSDTGPDRLVERVPEDWGAIGDGESHPAIETIEIGTLAELQRIYPHATSVYDEMDWLAIQQCLYDGGRVVGKAGATYVLNKMLTAPVGRSWPDFKAAVLDFRGMAPQTSSQNLVSNPSFASGTGWVQTGFAHTAVVFGAGVATWTDPGLTGTNFGQWGQQITIPAGKWRVQFGVSITVGASGGAYGLPYAGVGFYSSGVGTGASTITATRTRTLYTTSTETLYVDFEVAEETVAWMCYSCGNGNVVISSPVITPFYQNCAVWATGDLAETGDTSSLHWYGGVFWGPGPDVGIRCFLAKSFTGNSAQLHLHEVEIGARGLFDSGGQPYAFTGGVVYSDQAYLCSVNRSSIGYCNPAVQFLPGSINAGEDMVLNRVTLFNGGTGLDVRGGGQWNLYGVSLDYQRTDYPLIDADNGAVVNIMGANLETNPASVELIQLRGASLVNMLAGWILQGSGGTATAQAYAYIEDTFSALKLGRVWLYGANTASGDFARGGGRFELTELLGPANAGINGITMLMRTFEADCFGGAGRISGPSTASDMSRYPPPDGIGMICGIWTDGANSDRITSAGYAAATVDTVYGHSAGCGSLALTVDPAYPGGSTEIRVYYPVRRGAVGFDEFWYAKPTVVAPVARGPYAAPGGISTTAGSAVITVTDPGCQYIGGEGPQAGWTVTIAGSAAVGGIAAGSINGVRTVLERTGATSYTVIAGATASSTVAGGGGAGVTLTYSQTNVRIFDRRFFVKIVSWAADGRPIIGQELFTGEVDFDLPLAATGWTRKNMASWYAETAVPADPLQRDGMGRAPAWATHMEMRLSFQHLSQVGFPAMYVTDYFANA